MKGISQQQNGKNTIKAKVIWHGMHKLMGKITIRKRRQGKGYNDLLTKSIPHPVGMKARMQTITSFGVIWVSTTTTTKTDKSVINMHPLTSRNKSWKSALNRCLPADTAWKFVQNCQNKVQHDINLFPIARTKTLVKRKLNIGFKINIRAPQKNISTPENFLY